MSLQTQVTFPQQYIQQQPKLTAAIDLICSVSVICSFHRDSILVIKHQFVTLLPLFVFHFQIHLEANLFNKLLLAISTETETLNCTFTFRHSFSLVCVICRFRYKLHGLHRAYSTRHCFLV